MRVELIENVGYSEGLPLGVFLLDVGEKGLKSAIQRGKKIVVVGLGINAFSLNAFYEKTILIYGLMPIIIR